jgi:hypothetical protein
MIDGIGFIEHLNYNAFNECKRLKSSIENYLANAAYTVEIKYTLPMKTEPIAESKKYKIILYQICK